MICRIIKVKVEVSSPSRNLELITLRHWSFWISQKLNLIIVSLYSILNEKKEVMLLLLQMASNTKRTNLTWLPLEIMNQGHKWHDYPRQVLDMIIVESEADFEIHCTLSANQKTGGNFNVQYNNNVYWPWLYVRVLLSKWTVHSTAIKQSSLCTILTLYLLPFHSYQNPHCHFDPDLQNKKKLSYHFR